MYKLYILYWRFITFTNYWSASVRNCLSIYPLLLARMPTTRDLLFNFRSRTPSNSLTSPGPRGFPWCLHWPARTQGNKEI